MIIEAIVSAVIGACVAYLALSLLQMNKDSLIERVDLLMDAQGQYIERVNKEVKKNIIEIAKLQAKVAKLDSLIKNCNSIKPKEEKKNVKK